MAVTLLALIPKVLATLLYYAVIAGIVAVLCVLLPFAPALEAEDGDDDCGGR